MVTYEPRTDYLLRGRNGIETAVSLSALWGPSCVHDAPYVDAGVVGGGDPGHAQLYSNAAEGKEEQMKQLVLDLPEQTETQVVFHALDTYKSRLRLVIEASKASLAGFEGRHGAATDHFLRDLTAEDLPGGDLEYVEWAGEAKLLKRLEAELSALEGIRFDLS